MTDHELTEENIIKYGDKYQELTTLMNIYPSWDENAYTMKSEFFIQLIKNPDEEKMAILKETIKHGFSHVLTWNKVNKENIASVKSKIQIVNEARTEKEIRHIIFSLTAFVQSLS